MSRRRGSGLARDRRGAVYVETLVAFMPVFMFFLATLQIADLSVAHLIVQHASSAAARAAVVVLPDDGIYYEDKDNATLHQYTGLRRSDVELAADLVMEALPRLARESVALDKPQYAEREDLVATVTARYQCLIPQFCPGGVSLHSQTKLVYQGANYIYETTTIGDVVAARPGGRNNGRGTNPGGQGSNPGGSDRGDNGSNPGHDGNDHGSNPGNNGNNHGTNPGNNGNDHGSNPGNNNGNNHGSNPGNNNGNNHGNQHGSNPGNNNGNNHGANPGNSGSDAKPSPGQKPNPGDNGKDSKPTPGSTQPPPGDTQNGGPQVATGPKPPPGDTGKNPGGKPTDPSTSRPTDPPPVAVGPPPSRGQSPGGDPSGGTRGGSTNNPSDPTQANSGSNQQGLETGSNASNGGLASGPTNSNGTWRDSSGRLQLPVLNPQCFAAGTLVYTERGDRPIETIREGDLVWSRDEATGQFALKPVTRTFVTANMPVLDLQLTGDHRAETVAATPSHPFWVENVGWVGAGALGETALLWSPEGSLVGHAGAAWAERTKVYNLEVEGFHTYFVGSLHAWVHNDCPPENVDPSQYGDGYHWHKGEDGKWRLVNSDPTKPPLVHDGSDVHPDVELPPEWDGHSWRYKNGRWEIVKPGNRPDVPKLSYDPKTNTIKVDDGSRREPKRFAPETTAEDAYREMTAGDDGRPNDFAKYVDMLIKNGLAKNEQEVIDKIASDPSGRTHDSVRNSIKNQYKQQVADLIKNATHQEMLDITRQLGNGDKGDLAEIWYNAHRSDGAPTQVTVDPSTVDGMDHRDKELILDRVAGNTIEEIKNVQGRLGTEAQANIRDQLKLVGKEIIVNGQPQQIDRVRVVMVDPEGMRANASFFRQLFNERQPIEVEVFQDGKPVVIRTQKALDRFLKTGKIL